MKDHIPRWSALTVLILVMGLIVGLGTVDRAQAQTCTATNTITADVVALDQNFFLNRLGALNNLGMIYALARDVFPITGGVVGAQSCAVAACTPGQVVLRPDKRPRPIVLRVNKGDCLKIIFTNLLNPVPIDPLQQPVTRDASAHVTGLPLVTSIADDGSFVGRNTPTSLAAPGGTATYTYYAQDENVYMITSMGATTGAQGGGGTLTFGLYGAVVVEPAGAEYYRGHVTNEEMALAACKRDVLAGTNPSIDCLNPVNQTRTVPLMDAAGNTIPGTGDQPIIDYDAVYPAGPPFDAEGKAGLTILNMVQAGKLVHSDVHAIITGPNRGTFNPGTHYPSTSMNPRQDLPFREAASFFGDEHFNVQAFPFFFANPILKHTFGITKDGFVINYGGGGIGPEIIANRLAVGPMWDCPECKAEEFFLTSWAVGDVGMWVDIPANGCIQTLNRPLVNGVSVDPNVVPAGNQQGCGQGGGVTPGVKATAALYPDDPSTVHHAYIHDHFKFRNIHAGPFEHHIFHLHNNQWTFSPKSDKSNYMDMQQIGPGGAYTMDITNEGVGNRNAGPGDAIYHCHFYPHFAQGMWANLRMHDVFEEGTLLAPLLAADGSRAVWALRDAPPAVGSRAYPDGEVSPAALAGAGTCILDANWDGLCTGTPVVAVVPLPLYPMAPAPALASVDPVDPRRVVVTPNLVTGQTNPGFPFYIPGVAGHRPPSPPLDIAVVPGTGAGSGPIDGGLPRHIITAGVALSVATRYDINKELEHVEAEQLPEGGTLVEQASFAFHAKRCHDTYTPDGLVAACLGTNSAPNPAGGTGQPYYGGFITNGLPPQPGAPHADPCVDNVGNPISATSDSVWNSSTCAPSVDGCDPGLNFKLRPGQFDNANPRPYKVANIQIDLVLNKKGWHLPQQRIISLWGDVAQQYAGTLPPAPMVFRLNTLDCAEVWHANLVPNFYELDDFQVRTPTDIIAQHSHMTKFDVASSDGAANLWNYEDGTMSPGEIVERIAAINAQNALAAADPTGLTPPGFTACVDPTCTATTGPVNGVNQPITTGGNLVAKTHPYFEGQGLPFKTLGVANPTLAAAVNCTEATCGARTTVQRWLADPVLDNTGKDRGIGNVFTHDHFGPSTFQQLGLYATVLAEPRGSTWKHNETGVVFPDPARLAGGPSALTADGGPTSWQAIIEPGAGAATSFENTPYREFYFENSDFQQAYKRNWAGTITNRSYLAAISPAAKDGDPITLYTFPPNCPGGPIRPCPKAIAGDDLGTQVVNYRNEPVGARVFNPATLAQAAGQQGDLSFAFRSITRADADLNSLMPAYVRATQQCPTCLGTPGVGTGGANTFAALAGGGLVPMSYTLGPEIINAAAAQLSQDVGALDPATPMMRAYEGDRIKIRMQVGATEESHHFSMHGVKWLMNYADPNSGWRNVQSMGISEQFQFNAPILGDLITRTVEASTDYLYASNMSNSGLWNGEWGLLRSYNVEQANLARLSTSIVAPVGGQPLTVANAAEFKEILVNNVLTPTVCPANAPLKIFNITAVRGADVLPVDPVLGIRTLIYNSRPTIVPNNIATAAGNIPGGNGPLHDPTAIMYVPTANVVLNAAGAPIGLTAGTPIEPLILRANAGDCIEVNLTNKLPAVVPDLFGITTTLDPVIDLCPNTGCVGANKATFNFNALVPSPNVGLHAQLVTFDPENDDGVNVGQNTVNTIARNVTRPPYYWYAGDLVATPGQEAGTVTLTPRPIEYGVVGLSPSDKIKQASKGMMGALVIEPAGATCAPDVATAAQATCTRAAAQGVPALNYREFVAVTQNNVNMYFANVDRDRRFQFRSIPGFPTELLRIGVPDAAEDSGMKAVNYKTEPYWFRLAMAPATPLFGARGQQSFPTAALYSNTQVAVGAPAGAAGAALRDCATVPAGAACDPQTPLFTATAGDAIRFYFVEPAGNQRADVPVIHGHPWQRIPYGCTDPDTGLVRGCLPGETESEAIGSNPQSQVVGAQEGYGPAGHWNFIPEVNAGGPFNVIGDYLYRMQNPQAGYQGSWGVFRVR